MNSNQELITNSVRQSAPHLRAILTPIAPKIVIDDIYLEDIHDFKEPVTGSDPPEFVSAKWMSTQRSQTHHSYRLKYKHAQSVIQKNINQESTIYNPQEQDSIIITLIKGVIWICYLVSTAQTNFSGLSILLVVNMIGCLIASAISLKKLISGQSVAEDLLHLISLVTSITLHFYSVDNPQDPFVMSLHIIRSLRLLFPLNSNYSFRDFVLKYAKFIKKIAKVSIPLFSTVIVISLIFGQAATYDITNRCRASVSLSSGVISSPTDSNLCGSRDCPSSESCLNPASYNLQFNSNQYQLSSTLAYGFFSFENLYREIFSVISLGTLSNSAEITSIFSNSLPGYLMAILVIATLVLIHFSFVPILVVLLETFLIYSESEYDNVSSMENDSSDSGNQSPNKLKSEGSISHVPTFGKVHHESMITKEEKGLSKNTSEKRLSIDMIEIDNKPANGTAVKFEQVKEQTREVPAEEKESDCLNKCKQYLLIGGGVILSSLQFVLLLVYALGILGQIANQWVGIFLACLFIVWSVKLGLTVFQKYFDDPGADQEETECSNEENHELIFKIESFIYLMNLLDYICRIIEHVYLMQQTSVLTPVATASLILRITYPFLLNSKNSALVNQLKALANIQNFICLYVAFMFVIAAIFATVTMQLEGNSGFVIQIVKHFTSFSNQNWLSFYRNTSDSLILHQSEGYNFVIKYVLIVLGEVFLLKFIYSSGIAMGIVNISRQITASLPSFQPPKSYTQEQIQTILKSQKSFWLLAYQQKSIRSTLHGLLKYSGYTTIKEKIVIAYLVLAFLGQTLGKDSQMYIYFMLFVDCFLVLDALISITVLRFWGELSFTNYQWHPTANVVASGFLIASAFLFLPCQYLRVLRIFLLFPFKEELKKTYQLVKMLFKTVLKVFPLFILFLTFFFIICLTTVFPSTSTNRLEWVLRTPFMAVQLFKKGFDLPQMFNLSADYSNILCFQSSIFSLMMGIPFNCLCIALLLKFFAKQEEDLDNLKLKEFRRSKAELKAHPQWARQQFENKKLRQAILSITPQTKPQSFIESNYFMELTSPDNRIFQVLKTAFASVNASILILSYLLNEIIPEQMIVDLKLARVPFVIGEILMFSLEWLGHKGNSKHFMIMLLIYLISLPGTFISILPVQKYIGSKQLKQFLLIFVSTAPLSLINTMIIFGGPFSSVASYTYQKMNRTIWLLFFTFLICCFLGSILSIFVGEEFMVSMSYAFVGVLGGSQENALHMDQLTNGDFVGVFLINTLINVVGFVLRNGLFACAIFQISGKVRTNLSSPTSKVKDLSKNCLTLFDEEKFAEQWIRLDPKGKGYLSSTLLFHNLPHFLKSFKLYPLYIQFVVSPRSHIYDLKLELLRQVGLPIRIASQQNSGTVYAVTMYDLIARLLCLSLVQSTSELQMISDNQERSSSQQIKQQLPFVLGFYEYQWNNEVADKIRSLNGPRKEEWEIQEKYTLLKTIDMDSSHLASLIEVLPRMRTKVAEAKRKVKTH